MSEIGLYAIRLAFLATVFGIGAGIYSGVTRRADWGQVAERAVYAVLILLGVAMVSLFWALGTNDFSLEYVARHSARSMTLGYRLGALWGGQAGSLLLWAFLLMAFGSAGVFSNRRSQSALIPWVAVVLLANAGFFIFLLEFLTSPFESVPAGQVLSDGRGLNPLLQHPVMLIHPVMLYLGFTGFATPFAFAFAALVTGRLGTEWFRTTRRWSLFAWLALGAGIVLGGRWAYEVLGWGGYWAWDPVENASLMPWLAATAYLHSVMIQEKRDMLKTWNVILVGLTYSLCLFGTFLTRSGIVQSVHAFTDAGWYKPLFLGYVVFSVVAFSIAVFARRKQLQSPRKLESVLSRESSFILNNWVFMVLLAVVFGFTMLPVFSESFSGERLTLGPHFFNQVTGPLALILLFLTGVGPLIAWRKATPRSLWRQFRWPLFSGLVATFVLAVIFWRQVGYWSLTCWGLCAFVTGTIAQEYILAIRARKRVHGESSTVALRTLLSKNQRRYGGYIIHLGVVVMLLGISGSAFNVESLENIKPGQSAMMREYRIEYLTADPILAQHYGGATARLALFRDDSPLAVMEPEKRIYWLEDQPTTIPSIYSTWMEDIYVIVNAIEEDGSATIKIYRNPLVNWIWAGAIIFGLGGIAILWPHPPRNTPGRAA
ncbi:MAG: heme lyase CcmF/NrfE family subunit [Myxococcota bacterium]|nr:cytochrome C biogenesis protein [Spirochaeta sp.]RPG13123.1 MAG: heme lyase CcmF/NrfE family subunit [Proteobacteria bacterium TMED72]